MNHPVYIKITRPNAVDVPIRWKGRDTNNMMRLKRFCQDLRDNAVIRTYVVFTREK
jgi:hypothetical protein